nr:hypothetical protein [Tanacetum cinerariifolium]
MDCLRLDVFSVFVISRIHCVLCSLRFIFHHRRKERRWRVPEFEVEGVLAFTNLVIKLLRNPPSKHLVFEEPELDRQGPDKPVVRKTRGCALTMSFNLATSGDTPEVEAVVLTLATTEVR